MQQAPKAVEVEAVESPLLYGIVRLRLATIEESRQDASLEDAYLGPFAQQVIALYSLAELGHGRSFGDPGADIGIARRRAWHGGAQEGEGTHDLQLLVVDGNDWGDSAPCIRMLVFPRLINSPKILQALDSLWTRRWKP